MTSNSLLRDVLKSRSPLISAEQLEQLLDNKSVKIFDVRGTWKTPARALPEEYDEGHISGAFFLDWTKHFMEQGVPIGLASIAGEKGAEDAFKELGIHEDDLVVLYDDYSHMQAGRIWLAMRHWGFKNVRILNGGLKYWSAKNLPTTTDAANPGNGTFKPEMADGLKIDLGAFLERREHSYVIDARGPSNYAGNPEDGRSGHIPGALNIPFSTLLNPDTGLFLSSENLENLFNEKIPDWRNKPIIASCGSGYAATVLLIALNELDQAAILFDGSFAVWKQDPSRPVEQSHQT